MVCVVNENEQNRKSKFIANIYDEENKKRRGSGEEGLSRGEMRQEREVDVFGSLN